MLLLGCGLLPFLRLARTRRELADAGAARLRGRPGRDRDRRRRSRRRLRAGRAGPAADPRGAVAVPRPAPRSRRGGRPREEPIAQLPALVVLAATLFVAVPMARLLAVKPLAERDGWEIWATRARALYEFGHPGSPGVHRSIYPALQHPLLLPELEAVDFRFMGTFDGTLVHLQLLGLAIGFVGGAWTLLRRNVEADPARRDAAGARGAPDVLQPAPDELRRRPARDVRRASAWLRSRAGCARAGRACCRRPRSSSAQAR